MNTGSSNSSNPLQVIFGLAWLVLGLFLLLAFFLPNYTTPVLDIDGLDLLRTATRDPEALSRLTRDTPTFFMVITPFAYWFLGFVSTVIGIFSLTGRRPALGLFLAIVAGLIFLLSILTIYFLENRNDTPGFFVKMLPKPGVVFYMTMLAEAGLVAVGLVQRLVGSRARA